MRSRIERTSLPDLDALRGLLGERAGQIREGAKLVDADAQGPTGVDLIVANDEGSPVFVDIVLDRAQEVPTLIFDHLDWVERNSRLFLKAYASDGISKADEPGFVFVADEFPPGVVRAVGAMQGIDVRLIRAEYLLVDGSGDVLLTDVTPDAAGTAADIVVRRPGGDGGAPPTRSDESSSGRRIESNAVRTLMALFTSGVDGLDARITQVETDSGTVFALGERTLARVAVSPGSFTVSPGDRNENPIVVSDRVSLERALNAVVSLFVRDGGTQGESATEAATVELPEEEKAELASIWESVAAQGEAG
jgi:hypothetical protein